MSTFLHRSKQFLDMELAFGPRILLVVAAVALAATLVFPLWNMTMFAPQYQDGLRLDIYAHELRGGHNGQDLKEINLLNHYIGMRDLANDDFTEFKWMPFAIGALALLFLRAAVHGTMASLVDGAVVFCYFGAFSLWSFGFKLYQYGHNLLPTAAVKVPPFTPPIFGYKQMANFEVYSYPAVGTYLMLATAVAILAAVFVAWRSGRRAGVVPVAV